ncbi:DNA polymerase III subunit alpha (plasmid) [Citricoccus nitrophenolicus]
MTITAPEPTSPYFTHLHVHTEHSALDGLINAKKLPGLISSLGMSACAITDHGSLTGTLRFHEAALKAGIKPVIGMEAYMAIGSRFERNTEVVESNDDNVSDADEGKEKSKKYQHLTVLATGPEGWKNLLALHNKAEDSFWYRPRIDFELLDEHSEGIIALTGCLAGPVAGPLSRAGKADAEFRQNGPDEDWIRRVQENDEKIQAIADAQRARGEDAEHPEEEYVQLRELLSNMANGLVSHSQSEAHAKREMYREQAMEGLDKLIAAVGRDNVFLEVMFHSIGAEMHAFREIRRLSKETGIPMVVTNDCHYTHEGDDVAHDHFLAVGTGKSLDEDDRFRFNGTPDYYVKSAEQMHGLLETVTSNAEAIADWKQACANTKLVVDKIADRTIPEGKMRLPKFPVPEGHTEQSWFHKLVLDGAKERWADENGKLPAAVKERLRTEEDIITTMGFPAYFLIVADVINWARSDYTPADWIALQAGGTVPEGRELKKPILVGPGRGSAAGSACSYALGIVGVDPLRFGLLFERFLEPGRAGMPDIDVDFERDRRDEVLAYLQIRWGRENVAHLGTIGSNKTKATLKDAARILKPTQPDDDTRAEVAALREEGRNTEASKMMRNAMFEVTRLAGEFQATGNRLASLAPSEGAGSMPLAQIMKLRDSSTEAFHSLVDSSEIAQRIVETALPLEGLSKAEGIHACGFIISPEPLDELVPMRHASHKQGADPNAPRVITWEGGECDDYGLLKMDVLGLMNLDIAHQAMDLIQSTTGRTITLDTIPDPEDHSDPVVGKAFHLLSAGDTDGVFQLESSGMKQTAQAVKPEDLEDVSALVALYRPGPMSAGMDDDYAKRKNGLAPVTYTAFTNDPEETKWIASVFGQTYGLAIYQETIMRLGTVVAGFDAAQKSKLRKAMGKKIQAVMDQVHEMWNEGAGKEFHDEEGNLISPVFSEATANRLWDFIAGAASYLFNKSHSVAYGYLAYVTAYLKAGWPAEYGAAILSVVGKGKDEKRLATLQSLRAQGIDVLPPDVNTGDAGTSVVDGKIVLGMAEIKGVGSIAHFIVAEREKNGPFTSLTDLTGRVIDDDRKHITTSALAALAEAGALDCLPGSRLAQSMASKGALLGAEPPTGWTWSALEESRRQRQRIGVALGTHPVDLASDLLDALDTPGENDSWDARPSADWCHIEDIRGRDRSHVGTVGVVQAWTEKPYSKGRRVNFTLEGRESSISGVGWNEVVKKLASSGDTPQVGDLVRVHGRLQVRTVELEMEGEDGSTSTETLTVREIVADDIEIIPTGDDVIAPDGSTGHSEAGFAQAWRTAQQVGLTLAENRAAAKQAARAEKAAARKSTSSARSPRGTTPAATKVATTEDEDTVRAGSVAVLDPEDVIGDLSDDFAAPVVPGRVVVTGELDEIDSLGEDWDADAGPIAAEDLPAAPTPVIRKDPVRIEMPFGRTRPTWDQIVEGDVDPLTFANLGSLHDHRGGAFRQGRFIVLALYRDGSKPAEPVESVNGQWVKAKRGNWEQFEYTG